ncbi:uncharacterized protein LOC122396372 [Colletes gigas]|uniref:uncharacterized protein LOC122396372 n=1 Tax=Colletes gigas TaxID=935657 RepID=UPI001C9B903C|nr:uncharacterized protein LOC122396372 [Colletes gigas]
MKQVENYKPKYVQQSVSDSRNPSEGYWSHQQKKIQLVPGCRNSRNSDTVASYSCSATYKLQKGHGCSNLPHSKYTSPHGPDASHHLQGHSKFGREKHIVNFSSTRKNRYDDELGNNEKFKYFDDLGNSTEDNGEEDAEEEEDDSEEAEFRTKDYDEQEVDDEIDEESDATPRNHRVQRGKKEALSRQQRWRAVEQQQDPRRLCCQQRVLALGQGHSSSARCYRNVAEHDVPVPLSEEDFVPTSLKSPMRRPTADYHQWTPSRGESDRYDAAALPIQSRRARAKPEMDHLIESELSKPRKCNRCGNLSSKRIESPTRTSCRYDDRASFPTKGPIGDEPDSHEQMFCGRCSLRYTAKDVPPHVCSTKSRRSREKKSSTIYEVPEQGHLEQPSSSKYHRKPVDMFPEKVKRSMHASHGLLRVPPRYVE